MSPPTQVTQSQLKGMLDDYFKQAMGCTAEEFRKEREAEKAKQEAAVRTDYAGILGAQSDDGESKSLKAYNAKAKGLVKHDRHKGAGLRLGRLIRFIAIAHKSNRNVRDIALSHDDKFIAEDIEKAEAERTQQKTLTANLLSAGGAIVPNEYIAEMIELLRETAVVRQAGPIMMPMRTGTMTIPRQSAAATASYVGEASNITASQQTFEQIQLSAKKLAALTPVSNDLLRESDPSADQIVRDDLIRVYALREDLALLRGDGTANTPKGFLNRISSSNQFARTQASSPSTLAEVTNDLFQAQYRIEGNNVPIVRACWFMHSRTKFGLMRLRDSLGNLVFAPEMKGGTLNGFPFYVSNQIPITLSTNKSEIYLCEMTQAILADTYSLEIDAFNGGSYYDGSAVQSGVSQDLTIIRALGAHDFALRHDKGGAVINTIDWGL